MHNLNYDGTAIIDFLTKKNIYFEVFIRKMNIYSITIKYKDKIIVFKCSYKILPASLEKISTTFNINNKKMIFPYKFASLNNLNYIGNVPDYTYFNSQNEYNYFIKNFKNQKFNFKEYSIEYCMRDVEIVSKFVKNIENILSAFNIKIEKVNSAPSLALEIFINHFNKNKISFNIKKIIYNFIKKSYFGGRCEVYGNPNQNEKIFHFDFSGMYGQCMMENFPYGKIFLSTNEKEIKKPGFYNIIFQSNMKFPILPMRDQITQKLMFVNGTILEGTYYFEEINYFLNNGGIIKKINYAYVYNEYEKIFDKYVDFFTNIRKKGQEYKTFGKLMINSLYGRMGMSNEEEYTLFIKKSEWEEKYQNLKLDTHSLKEINNYYLISIELNSTNIKIFKLENKKIKNKINGNIALASAITSKARIKLHKAQNNVIDNGGRILYSDTDSIFAAYKKNVINEHHGEIFWDSNKEDTIVKDAFFMAPKSYALINENNKETIKIKGTNEKNISFYDLKKKFYNNEILHFEKCKFIEKKNLKLKTSYSTKTYDLAVYDKRKFIKNKKDTLPFIYENFSYK